MSTAVCGGTTSATTQHSGHLTSWPDTSGYAPPVGNPNAIAAWLLGRHPFLAGLVDQIPGLLRLDEDGRPDLDMGSLAQTLQAYAGHQAAMTGYARSHQQPADPAALHLWLLDGPAPPSPAVRALAELTPQERACLHLLGLFTHHPTTLQLHDFDELVGAPAHELLRDWCQALQEWAGWYHATRHRDRDGDRR